MNIRIQLSKIGLNNLLEILGKKTYELFKVRGLKEYSSQSLAKLIVDLYGESESLHQKVIRDSIINTFKPAEIQKFFIPLISNGKNDPWEQIKNLKFKENRLVFIFISLSVLLFLIFKLGAFTLIVILYIFINLFRSKI